MTCTCPYPVSPITAPSCCRLGAEPTCPPERCQHAEPDADELYAVLRATLASLAAARERHRIALEERRTAADAVMELEAERSRLWVALGDALARDAGIGETVRTGTG